MHMWHSFPSLLSAGFPRIPTQSTDNTGLRSLPTAIRGSTTSTELWQCLREARAKSDFIEILEFCLR